MYQREPGFKLDLAKTLEFGHTNNDFNKRNPKVYLGRKHLRHDFLAMQEPEKTENFFKVANGHNVCATFERLRREVQDLHFLGAVQKKSNNSPIFDYQSSPNFIKFVTQRGPRKVAMTLTLANQPPSIVNSRMPTGQFIKVEIDRKIKDVAGFSDTFVRSVCTGELLIDFINKKLWTEIEKAENNVRHNPPPRPHAVLHLKPNYEHRQSTGKDHHQPDSLMNLPFNYRNDRGNKIPRQPLSGIGRSSINPPNHHHNYTMPCTDIRKIGQGGGGGRGGPFNPPGFRRSESRGRDRRGGQSNWRRNDNCGNPPPK